MANKNLFSRAAAALRIVPATDAHNASGAPAYARSHAAALAQYAATGCLNGTFYASAELQLARVLEACGELPSEYIAQVAVFARERGHMKDLPAVLCAVLAARDVPVLARVFDRVIDNGKMLRNFVQVVRSGATGRRSLGTFPRRLVRRWFEARTDAEVFCAAVGNDPSLADVIKLAHPKPHDARRRALYGYLLDRPHDPAALPELVQRFEAFKSATRASAAAGPAPEVPFQMLTALPLDTDAWCEIAVNAGWQATRMNLNTFARHGVFTRPGMAEALAARLRDPEAVARARAFPYQLMTAFTAAQGDGVPGVLRDALQDAMEHATANVPALAGQQVFVCVDTSGSMSTPVTGYRPGATSVVRCIDVAALIAAAVLRKNPGAVVLPFAEGVKTSPTARLNPRDSVMTNARVLAALGGGGTNCSAPLAHLNAQGARGDLVVFVSDNESWMDTRPGARGTGMMREWEAFRARNPRARLVCIDLQPGASTQAPDRADVLNVGGFSDAVFELLASFATQGNAADHWVEVIRRTAI